MKYIQYVVCLFCFIAFGKSGYAQYGNPILTTSFDGRGAALGQLAIFSEEAPLLSMPTLIFRQKTSHRLRLATTFALSSVADRAQRQYYHSISSAYRFRGHHAVLLGFRYWQGIPTHLNAGGKLGTIYPQDWSIDVAYAYALSSRVKLSLGLSYFNTYHSQSAQSLMTHISGHYEGGITWLNQGEYLFGLSVRNLGEKMSYGKQAKSSSPLPLYTEVSTRIGFNPIATHRLQVGMAMRYYPSMSGIQPLTYQAGAEYSIPHLFALRLGTMLQSGYSLMTFGAGKDLGKLQLSMSYTLHTYPQFNTLNMGLSVSL